jgi:hypothetical protein
MAVPQGTFQARRPFSSSELLARQKLQIEKSMNLVPSINLQDSSEFTARVRKMNSVLKTDYLPYGPTKGNSGNMVKFNDCSVVQSMLAGQSYRTSATNYQVRQPYTSQCCSNILVDNIKYPKVITCEHPISNSHHIVRPFNPVVEFGMRQNDNKVVIAAQPAVDPTAKCYVDNVY